MMNCSDRNSKQFARPGTRNISDLKIEDVKKEEMK